MARSNGGIIGKRNATSHGKSKQTVKTSSGSVTLQSGTNTISAFMVAGGGAGGRGGPAGGGGGAGGVNTAELDACGTATVTIGAGATGGQPVFPSGPLTYGTGNNTTVANAGGTSIQACGGGGGGARGPGGPLGPGKGGPGGSGGGGGNPGFAQAIPGAYPATKGCAVSGQGNPGGAGFHGSGPPGREGGGGGGGHGAVGGDGGQTSTSAPFSDSGDGGAGTDFSPLYRNLPNSGTLAAGGGGANASPGTCSACGGSSNTGGRGSSSNPSSPRDAGNGVEVVVDQVHYVKQVVMVDQV